MFLQPPKYTDVGRALHNAIIGTATPLTFTKMQMGDGYLGTREIRGLTALISPRATITVNVVERNEEYVTISAPFTNTGITEAFMFREIGLFAADPNNPSDRNKDILFCYQNAGDQAEPIPPGSQQLLERTIRLPMKQSDVAQVIFSETASTLFAELDPITRKVRQSQLPEMVDYVPIIQKGAAGGVAELDAGGKVPAAQLPAMNYIPTSQKGATSGVASLGEDGKVPAAQLPAMNYIPTSQKGAAGGVAELDVGGKVSSSQLPSYVDDVLEYTNKAAFPAVGESGKIYVATDTNLTWRWSGTAYVEISPSLALGETASTAYRGDRGKSAYDHIGDTTKHITADERAAWNGKAAGNHTHGALTNDGKLGTTAGQAVFTGAGGALGTKTPAEALALMGTVSGVTAGTASILTLSHTGYSLSDGACIRIKFHLTPAAGATLNVADTGAKPIVTGKGKPFSGAAVGSWATVIYSATMDSFILQGEGGGGSSRFGNEPGQISTYQLVTRAWVPSLGG